MPIQVDRHVQREHVTSLAARLVAQEGVAALTFRRVAGAAGSSTAIVSTYFTDKRDLLLSTFRAAASRTTVRFEAAINAGGSLQDCLEAWLPLDEDRLTDWRVILAFWGVAVTDPELAAVQDGHVSRAQATAMTPAAVTASVAPGRAARLANAACTRPATALCGSG